MQGNFRKSVKMKPLTKKLISAGIVILTIALAVWYISANAEEFLSLRFVSPWHIALMIPIFIVMYFVIGVNTQVLLRPFGLNLRNGEAFALSIMTGFYNLIMPFRGGMAARAIYLKKKHKFPYTNFMATLGASYVLVYLMAAVLGLVASYFIFAESGRFSWIVSGIFLLLFLGMLGITFISPRFKEPRNKWLARFVRVLNGWHLIKGNARVIVSVLALSCVQLLLSAVMLKLQFAVFGWEISFWSALFISSLASLSLLVGLTPAGLGIQEAFQIFTGVAIGIDATQTLTAALLGRAVSLVVLFILGPIFSWVLVRKGKEKVLNNKEM